MTGAARAAIAILLLLSSPRPTVAADADAYGAALTRAIAAKERALDVNEPPRWEEALRLFQEAATLRTTRECAYEIGFAAERLKREDLAVEAYEAALDLGLVGPPRTRSQAYVAAHAAGLARLKVRGAAGTRLRAAGLDRGRLPLPRPLALYPGDVRLEIVDPKGRATIVDLRLKGGQLEVLDLDQERAAEAAPAAPSPPPASAMPPAEPAPAPATPIPAPAAPAPAPPAPLAAAPAPAPADLPAAQSSPAAWPLIIAGAAVAVAGVVMLPVSSDRIDAHRSGLADVCTTALTGDSCPVVQYDHGPDAQSHVDGIATWKAVRLGAWIGIGVGAAAAIVGTVLKLREPAAPTGADPMTPAVVLDTLDGRRMVGVGWGLRF